MVKNKTAATGSQSFTFNNSLAKGRKFVGDLSKLMLRGYNAEADICVRVLKAGNLESRSSGWRRRCGSSSDSARWPTSRSPLHTTGCGS